MGPAIPMKMRIHPTDEPARQAQTFRTRWGACVVDADRLEFTVSGARDWVSAVMDGGSIVPGILVYVLIGGASFAFGLQASLAGRWSDGAFDVGLGLAVLALAWVDRHRSAAPRIALTSIERIVPFAPVTPHVPGRFDIWFEDGRRRRCRYLVLPRSEDGGDVEFAKACRLFRAAGHLPPV